MARVFLSEGGVEGVSVTVRGDDAHHLTVVLRLGPGDCFEAVTPDCKAHEVVISSATRREVRGEIVASREVEREAGDLRKRSVMLQSREGFVVPPRGGPPGNALTDPPTNTVPPAAR